MPEEDDPLHSPVPDDATQMMTPPTGGGSILPQSSAPLREVIGDFEILGKLGAGGMGAVYRARQVSLGRRVALKILPHQFMEDADSVARFQREARVAASLSHANLVKVYSAGEADGCHFIAMELIEGEDLGQRIKHDGKLPPPEALRIIADVARGLQFGWQSAHLVHRDIKPGNIFLATDGAVKLGDLGLAKSVLGATTTGLTQTGTMMGTPYYISPEQARGDKELDFRADIYSLGCTLYHLLTGQVPYSGTDPITIIRQHLDAPLPAILKVWPQCPIPLARLVGKMLKKSRHERHASYEELITQIESVWAQIDPLSFSPETFAPPTHSNPNATLLQTPHTPAPTITQPATPTRAKSRVPLYAGLAIALIAIAVGAFVFRPKEEPLTKAQIAIKQREAEAKAAAAKATPLAATAPQPPDSGWQPLVPGTEWKSTGRQGLEFKDGLLHVLSGQISRPQASANAAIRVRVHIRQGTNGPQIHLRSTSGNGKYTAAVTGDLKSVQLVRFAFSVASSIKTATLRSFVFPKPLSVGDAISLELRAQGTHLSVLVNGAKVIEADDDQLQEPGLCGLYAADGWFESAEIQTLSTASSTESWQDALRGPGALSPAQGLQIDSSGLTISRQGVFTLAKAVHNGAIRVRGKLSPEWASFKLVDRRNETAKTSYQFELKDNAGLLHRADGNQFIRLPGKGSPAVSKPLILGQDVEMELRIVGTHLTGKIDGETLVETDDTTFADGTLGLGFGAVDKTIHLDSVEYLALDAPGAVAATATSNPPLAPTAIKLWNGPDKIPATAAGITWENNILRLEKGSLRSGPNSRDAILRVSTRMDPDAKRNISLRQNGDGADQQSYYLLVDGLNNISLRSVSDHKTTTLQSWPLPRTYRPDEWAQLELRAIGSSLTATFDGITLGTVTDTTVSAPGRAMIFAGTPSSFRDIEYTPLDGTTPATPAPTPEPWQNLLGGSANLATYDGAERTPDGLRFSARGSAYLPEGQGPFRDAAVRLRTSFGSGRLGLRARSTTAGIYGLGVAADGKSLVAWRSDQAGQTTTLQRFPLHDTLAVGEQYQLELRLVGQTLTAKFNGQVIGTLTDGTYAAGRFGVGVAEGDGFPVMVKSLEFLNLDPPAAASREWKPLVSDSEWRATTAKGREFKDGWLHVQGVGVSKPQPAPDGAVRAHIQFREGTHGPGVVIRNVAGQGEYDLYVWHDGTGVDLRCRLHGKEEVQLGKYTLPKPLQPGDAITLELRARGDHFTGSVNGTAVIEVQDTRITTAGLWGISATDGWFESAEVQP